MDPHGQKTWANRIEYPGGSIQTRRVRMKVAEGRLKEKSAGSQTEEYGVEPITTEERYNIQMESRHFKS